ncbi:YveK family protein [Paenibacillus daejeonensis]|uniref:YveK family protein n=1 Tax=Paenibacillus daejeonensis TaxID=135193 RepID=UPI0003679559|nr:Wzz/FepE/Etk N-terminal domain-containing protein [Paenibacillus daejeonensis]
MELKQYWTIVKKRLWLIIMLMVLGGGGAGLYSYMVMNPVYEASTKLIVNQSSEASMLAKLDLGTINSNIQLVKTYKEIIQTPRIMGVVAEQHPELGLTAQQLVQKINVSSVNDTQVMNVSARDVSYEKAALIVNSVSEVFMQEIPLLMQVDNVSILNTAELDRTPAPVSPSPKLNIAAALLLAGMLGMGAAFLLEYLDDTIKSEDDVMKVLDMPTLSVIPRMKERDFSSNSGKLKPVPVEKKARSEKNVPFEA